MGPRPSCWPAWQQTGRYGAGGRAECSHVKSSTVRQRKEPTVMARTFETLGANPKDTLPPTRLYLLILHEYQTKNSNIRANGSILIQMTIYGKSWESRDAGLSFL